MKRPLQVYLDAEELRRLTAWSRERGVTKSEAVRVALRGLTREPNEDPLLGLIGICEGPADASERLDHYLNESLIAERAPAYRKSRSRRARVRR